MLHDHSIFEKVQLLHYESSMNQTPQVQIGAIFHGPVEGSQIQAFASAVNSSVQQAVSNTSSEEIKDVILDLVEDIVTSVKNELSVDELVEYASIAKGFKEEIAKEEPDKKILREFMSKLSFLSDVEGIISLSERAFFLAERVMPYIPVLIGYINNM